MARAGAVPDAIRFAVTALSARRSRIDSRKAREPSGNCFLQIRDRSPTGCWVFERKGKVGVLWGVAGSFAFVNAWGGETREVSASFFDEKGVDDCSPRSRRFCKSAGVE